MMIDRDAFEIDAVRFVMQGHTFEIDRDAFMIDVVTFIMQGHTFEIDAVTLIMSTDVGQQHDMRETGERKTRIKLKLIGLAVLAAVLFASVVAAFWNWVDLQKKPLEGTKRQFDASLDFVKTTATIVGGVVLFLNFRVAKDSVELAQKKLEQETEKAKNDAKLAEARLTMERFSKAVEMMGSDKSIHLRLGGIYALESIALDSSDDKIDENYRQVLEVLTAFVRIPLQPIEQPTVEVGKQYNEIPLLRTDIQAALTVLKRRKHKDKDWTKHSLDLHKADLRRANLREADFRMVNLGEANLQGAFLGSADLQNALLQGADLQTAFLQEADLQRTHCSRAKLQESFLRGAKLQGADFMEARFQGADLREANLLGAFLQKADFREAKLQRAFLREASIQRADLQGADLQGADLQGANLQEANLYEANLQEVILLSTDLHNTEGLIREALEGEKAPLLCNVALPKEILVNPNRDCDRLPQELVKRYPNQFPSIEEAKQYVDEHRQKKWE